jgi:deoxyadenosine/deoxycytidine kinase
MKIFSIEGNIGSGKSTLIKNLKKNIPGNQFTFLQEPVDVWNEIKDNSGKTILEHYYQDNKRYAFSFQMMAYISRLSQIRKCNPDSIIITERCLFTDREIFAKMLYDSGDISEIEYTIYLKWFDEFSFPVTGYIYVQTTPETCSKRIEIRNRKGENIPLSYLKNCHEYHENWLTKKDTFYVNGELEQNDALFDTIFNYINLLR